MSPGREGASVADDAIPAGDARASPGPELSWRLTSRLSGAGWIIGLGAVVSALLVTMVSAFIWHERGQALQDGARELGSWAHQMSSDAERAFFDTDTQLSALGEWLTQQGVDSPEAFERVARRPDTHEWLIGAVSRSSGFGGMLLINDRGVRLASSRLFPTPALDLSDRSYFVQLTSGSGLAQVITAPMKNRQSGVETVLIARRLESAQGELLGLMVANIPTPRFTRAFDRAQDAGVGVALIRRTGELLVAGRGAPVSGGDLIQEWLPALQSAWAQPAERGWASVAQPTDSRHLVVTHALLGYPLAVVTAAPLDSVLAAWRASAQAMAAITAGALLMLWGLAIAALRQVRLQGLARESALLASANQALQAKVLEVNEAQAALATLNAELETRIAQRTEQLSAALDEAHQASLAKSRFLAQISHELRTPLNAVLGFSQVLASPQSAALQPAQLEQVNRIEASAEYLLNLINDLLDLGSSEGSGVPVHNECFGLEGLLRDVMDGAESLGKSMGVTLSLAPVESGLAVVADRLRLHQVLMNLVSNAIKYNRPAGRVTVRARRSPPGQEPARVAIDVEDTGLGLTQSQMAQLFQSFNRLGAEATAVQGTGIGLVIARALVERMQGSIEVQSQAGEGSCFTVTLPAAQEFTEVPLIEMKPDAGIAAAAVIDTDSVPLHVLYVEDHPANIALVVAMCQGRAGIRLSLAGSGVQAVAMVADERPDLMLVDMNLGDMTGLELRQALLDRGLATGLRMVVLSADAMPAHIEAARMAGFDGYLTKPLRLRELMAAFADARRDRASA